MRSIPGVPAFLLLFTLLSLLSRESLPRARASAALGVADLSAWPIVRQLNLTSQAASIAVVVPHVYWLPSTLRVRAGGLLYVTNIDDATQSTINVTRSILGKGLPLNLELAVVRADSHGLLHLADTRNGGVLKLDGNGTFVSAVVGQVVPLFLDSFDVSPDGLYYFVSELFDFAITQYSSAAAVSPKPVSHLALGGAPSNLAFFGTSQFYLTNRSAAFGAPHNIGLLSCSYTPQLKCVTVLRLPDVIDDGSKLSGVGAVVALTPTLLTLSVLADDDGDLQTEQLCFYFLTPTNYSHSDLQCQLGAAADRSSLAVEGPTGPVAALDARTLQKVNFFALPPPPSLPTSSSMSGEERLRAVASDRYN
jgi:hypothetical protein